MTSPNELKRPKELEFLLEFCGDPEETIARQYIEALEARAALAQPEPEGPTDEEWEALKERLFDHYRTVGYQGELFIYDRDFDLALDDARQELARWGRPDIR
jgi:hypothetical protein